MRAAEWLDGGIRVHDDCAPGVGSEPGGRSLQQIIVRDNRAPLGATIWVSMTTGASVNTFDELGREGYEVQPIASRSELHRAG